MTAGLSARPHKASRRNVMPKHFMAASNGHENWPVQGERDKHSGVAKARKPNRHLCRAGRFA